MWRSCLKPQTMEQLRLKSLERILEKSVKDYTKLVETFEKCVEIPTNVALMEEDQKVLVYTQEKIKDELVEGLSKWAEEYGFKITGETPSDIKYSLLNSCDDPEVIKAINKNTRGTNFYELQISKLILKYSQKISRKI